MPSQPAHLVRKSPKAKLGFSDDDAASRIRPAFSTVPWCFAFRRFRLSMDGPVVMAQRQDLTTQTARCELPRSNREMQSQTRLHYACGQDYFAVAVADLDPSELRQSVDRPEARLDEVESTVIKQGRSALIVKSAIRRSDGPTWTAYKKCGGKTWIRRFARGLQSARSLRNFHLGQQLLRHGIATARPLLAVAPRWHALLRPAFLATEWLEGAIPLDRFFRATAALEPAKRRAVLRETANRVGQAVAALHANGFSHRDLKATNVLVREQCGQIEVFVIDLDGVSKPWYLTRRTRMTNLARLVYATQESTVVTHSLRRRALAAYLTSVPDSRPWKIVWRQLREVSRIRRSRKASRAR
jgi:tRNA A-37 threonylcarbamoyl transferase component Bud32